MSWEGYVVSVLHGKDFWVYSHSGHFTYECKGQRPYVSRPSRTKQLENPRLAAKLVPTVDVPEEFKKP